jgi:hypothetical protein
LATLAFIAAFPGQILALFDQLNACSRPKLLGPPNDAELAAATNETFFS